MIRCVGDGATAPQLWRNLAPDARSSVQRRHVTETQSYGIELDYDLILLVLK